MDELGRPSGDSKFKRLLSDPSFRRRVLRYSLGLPTPLHTEDRHVLEEVIFQHYRRDPAVRTVLFVGTDWYTKHYERMYFSKHTFWTIDVAPNARKFGASRHLTCALEDLEPHFPREYFDLIISSGVFGFGLNSLEACERAFATCHALLRRGGHLVLGWNDVPTDAQCALEDIDSLRPFKPQPLPALGTDTYRTDTPLRHVFQFYVKEEA